MLNTEFLISPLYSEGEYGRLKAPARDYLGPDVERIGWRWDEGRETMMISTKGKDEYWAALWDGWRDHFLAM
jgi:hypothetical protein